MAAMVLACPSCGLPSMSKGQQEELDKVIAGFMKEHHFPGVMVGAWVPGKGTYVVARGKSDLKTGKPLRTEDKFGVGSVTKSIVATVLLQLVDEGKLKLDDAVSKYISWVPNGDSITIRQLLNMTSGLHNYTEDETMLAAVAADPLRKWAPEELARAGVSGKPYFPPGEGWYYSNTNTILVGLIIEKITGNKLEDEVKSRVVDRLGLKNTYFPKSPTMTAPYTHGYNYDEEGKEYTEATKIDPSFVWAAGAMVSDLQDLRVWAEALGTGKLISKAMQKERERFNDMVPPGMPEPADGMDPGYGLAMMKYDDTNYFIGITGRTNAYDTQVFYLPSEKATLITFANTHTADGDGPLFFATVSKIVFPGSFPKLNVSQK
jgi:D-alanyl-D-alanine carboxypeptidase